MKFSKIRIFFPKKSIFSMTKKYFWMIFFSEVNFDQYTQSLMVYTAVYVCIHKISAKFARGGSKSRSYNNHSHIPISIYTVFEKSAEFLFRTIIYTVYKQCFSQSKKALVRRRRENLRFFVSFRSGNLVKTVFSSVWGAAGVQHFRLRREK